MDINYFLNRVDFVMNSFAFFDPVDGQVSSSYSNYFHLLLLAPICGQVR